MNKKILIFTDNYPFGKSESFLDTEIRYIAHAFENVSVFPFETGKDKKIREMPERIELVRSLFTEVKNKSELLTKGFFNSSLFGKLIKEGLKSKVWKSFKRFSTWLTHFLVIRSALNEIKRKDLLDFFNQFDVLYFYWGLRWSQILPFLPPDFKGKIVVRLHGSDLYEHTNNGYIPWRHEQLARINKAVTISETGKKYIENQYPFLKDRILVSRLGTDDHGLNPYTRSETIRIVSCSNLVPVKRVGLIVETLSHIRIRVNWIHFGNGSQMEAIKALTKRLPVHINAEMKGAVGHDELMDYYRTTSIDLLINVSSSEGVPVSVMEAMSFGIPVIATNVGGTSEIVSEKTGMLIDPDFYTIELADNIEALVNREDIPILRKASREKWEKISKAENVYPEFIEELLRV